jgi:hypothetical protein
MAVENPVRSVPARERGQALLEWLLVAALAIMAAVWAASDWVHKAEQTAAQGHAKWLLAVAGSIEQALQHHDAHAGFKVFGQAQLPINTPVPVAPWLVRLKEQGWLSAALTNQPSLPYTVSLLRLDHASGCEGGRCPVAVLLLATPKPASKAPHPATLLSALEGRGLAVTDLAPHRLQGATYGLANPPVAGAPLPLGTVALLAWRADRVPPYVRLRESRPVQLAGGLQLGQAPGIGHSCHPDGLMMRGVGQKLLVCVGGRWETNQKEYDYLRSCQANPAQNQSPPNNALRQGLIWLSGFASLFENTDRGTAVQCLCPGGFVPVFAGTRHQRLGSVVLQEGYLCQRL